MRLSEKLRRMAVGKHVGFASLLEAADLFEATEPRPWPPPEGVEECLAWRSKEERWFVIYMVSNSITAETEWAADVVMSLKSRPPLFWQPMPPEPEESK